MEQPSERPSAARFGRFFKLLVGDTNAEPDDVIDLTDGPPDLERIELRIRRLERGVALIADAVRRSHQQTEGAIDRMQSDLRERDRVTRSEVQRMLWQALGPLSASVEQLAQSVREVPHAQEPEERVMQTVPAPAADPPDAGPEVHTSALWSWAERGVEE